jgi:hypothetical protein
VVDLAHASLHHWRVAGGPVEAARGEWLVSHVYAVLGRGEPALHHARRSYELCAGGGEEFRDFDLAYAYEGMARGLAALGADVGDWRAKAAEAGAAIRDDEDRSLFEGDFAAEPWYGA